MNDPRLRFRPPRFRQRGDRPACVLALLCASIVLGAAGPDEPGSGEDRSDIGTVKATGGAGGDQVPGTPFPAPPPGTPAAIAPSRAPLEASQPTSVVGKSFIDNSTIAAQNYDELIKFTPSLMNLQPAGPVSQQNYGESIRGFQYTQVNTTFDGIVLPGGPSNFAPQSAVYFTSHDLGSVNVERGPGTASQIGYATFGGTIGLLSKSPSTTVSLNPYASFGSFEQQLFGIEGDTGVSSAMAGGRGLLDLSHLTTNAALTGVTTDRTNAFTKWEQPVGDSTVLTFVGMINDSYGHTAYGSTLQQIATLGPDYGLNNNPKSQANAGYNTDIYDTDFEYLRARSDLGSGFGIDQTVYTASYFRHGTEGADPNGTTPNLSGKIYINNQPVTVSNDVQGVTKHNDFRDWGSITRGTYDTPWGQARVGLWFDYVANGVYRNNIDFDRGYVAYTTKPNVSTYTQYYHDYLTTVQPYVEFAWKPIPELTVTPGVKFMSVTRSLDVALLSGSPAGKSSHNWTDTEPSIDAHYKIRPDWVVYAQVAEGFLAPPLSTLDTATKGTVTPQTTTNYQIGTTYQTDRMTLSGDAYYIPFNNFITSQKNATGTLYSNSGGALYKGVELEGTVRIKYGVSVYANGTLNSATFDDGASIYQAPQRTAALGPIFDGSGLLLPDDKGYVSVLWKEVGKQYGQNANLPNGSPEAYYPIKSYGDLDMAARYTMPILNGRKINVGLNLFNVMNNRSLIGFAGTTAGTPTLPLYWTNPGRSFFVSLSATL
jgi:iron complex outermembrane receptor protein